MPTAQRVRMYGGMELTITVEEIANELDIPAKSIPVDLRRKALSIDDGVSFIFEPFMEDGTNEPGIDILLENEPTDCNGVMHS